MFYQILKLRCDSRVTNPVDEHDTVQCCHEATFKGKSSEPEYEAMRAGWRWDLTRRCWCPKHARAELPETFVKPKLKRRERR